MERRGERGAQIGAVEIGGGKPRKGGSPDQRINFGLRRHAGAEIFEIDPWRNAPGAGRSCDPAARNETIVAIVTPQPALSPAIAICRGSMPADSRNR
jgi:hypothetical protein